MKRRSRQPHLRIPDAASGQESDVQSTSRNSAAMGSVSAPLTSQEGARGLRMAGKGTGVVSERVVESPAVELDADRLQPAVPQSFLLGAFVIAAALLAWSYWPVWASLIKAWNNEPDYSHGWFVIPITAYMLWSFRDSMPKFRLQLHWGGVLMLVVIALVRVLARWAYFDFVDAWMIPLSVIALAWTLGGRRLAWWAFPSLFFLFFMIPLPFRLESELSRPLQWIATNASCFVLQTLGQPAIAEGTTILLGDNTLEVERACSGLRIFLGVFALSYICALLMRRSWWEGVILVMASIPIALISNAARIVATGLCYQWLSGEAARSFAHDFAGYVMIFFAAGLFGLTLWYLRWLIQDAVTMDQASLKRV